MQFFDYYHGGQQEVALDVCKPLTFVVVFITLLLCTVECQLSELIWGEGVHIIEQYVKSNTV